MLQQEIKERDVLVEIKGLGMKSWWGDGGDGGAGSVYRARQDAIRIVLRCDEVYNFVGKVTFQKLMGSHEEIVPNTAANCGNRNDHRTLVKSHN
jgi:hypothetical protein